MGIVLLYFLTHELHWMDKYCDTRQDNFKKTEYMPSLGMDGNLKSGCMVSFLYYVT